MHAGYVHLSTRVRQLHDKFAVKAAHSFAKLLPVRNEVVAMDGRVAGDYAPLHQHRDVRRDYGADAALREFAFPIDPRLGQRAVFVVETAGNAGAKNTVLDLQIVKFQRCKDDIAAGPGGGRCNALVHRFGHVAMDSCKLRRHTIRRSPVTKARAGHAFQWPCMKTSSGPGARGHAASSCSIRMEPTLNGSFTSGVSSGTSTVRGTCFGGMRHCQSTASSLRDSAFGPPRNRRICAKACTMPCTPIAVPCIVQRSALARSTKRARARRSCPVSCHTI